MRIEKGIKEEEITSILNYSHNFFKNIISKKYFDEHVLATTNFDLSAKLLTDINTLKGVYLIGTHQVTSMADLPEYKDLIGVEGVLLAIDEDIRGIGFGGKLKDYPKSLGVDYIWGQQFKALDNLDDWLKRRVLVHETEEIYVTVENFTK